MDPDNLPVQNLVVQIEPVQEGSGDPSPDNVRAISGWTGAKVTGAGKNLLNPLYRSNLPNNIRYYYGIDNATELKKGTYTLSISQQVNGIYVNQYGSTLFVKYNTAFITFTLDSEADGIHRLFRGILRIKDKYTDIRNRFAHILYREQQSSIEADLKVINDFIDIHFCLRVWYNKLFPFCAGRLDVAASAGHFFACFGL